MRESHIPARAVRRVSIPVLSAADDSGRIEWHPLLYAQEQGESVLLRASDDFRIDSEILYDPGESVTLVVADTFQESTERIDRLTELAAVMRIGMGQSRATIRIDAAQFPAVAEGLGTVDHIVLGSSTIAEFPGCLASLRNWLVRGGRLWIRLDYVRPQVVHDLLGDLLQITSVDQTSLLDVQLKNVRTGQMVGERRTFDYPVDFVRVVVDGVQVLHEIDGWPASFSADVGQGRVLFTTAGDRTWVRPRTDADRPAESRRESHLIGLTAMTQLIDELTIQTEEPTWGADALRPFLSAQVGYRIPDRQVILMSLSMFCILLLAAGIWLHRRKRHTADTERDRGSAGGLLRDWLQRPESLAVLGPVLALTFAVPIAFLGQFSRRAVPPGIHLAEFAQVNAGGMHVHSTGLAAVYSPNGLSADFPSSRNRLLIPSRDRASGTVRRLIRTDYGTMRWDDLSVPAGLNFFSAEQTTDLSDPVSASVRFGPEGPEVRLTTGPFVNPEDPVLVTHSSHALGIDHTAGHGGQFAASAVRVLDRDTFIFGSLLSDRQSLRQTLYRRLLMPKNGPRFFRRPTLLVWMQQPHSDFEPPSDFRTTHTVLTAVPVTFEAPAPGTEVVIPSPLVEMESVRGQDGSFSPAYDRRAGEWRESSADTRTLLKFRVPDVLNPITFHRGQLEFQIRAPGRDVNISAGRREDLKPLISLTSPVGVYNSVLDSETLLRVDDGAVFVEVHVTGVRSGKRSSAVTDGSWKMEFIRMHLEGRTEPDTASPKKDSEK